MVQRVPAPVTPARVAFTLIGGVHWAGGYNYLVNLLGAIDGYESGRVRPVLLSGEDAAEGDLLPFLGMTGVEVVRSPVFSANRSAARLKVALLWGVDHAAAKLFREHGISAVFEPATFYGWRCPIPAIAWLPDFQHRRLRNQFGARTYWRRELGFQAQVASGRIIMLSSEDARKDCERFYPGSIGSTAVVRFAARLDPSLIEKDPRLTVSEYRLPDRFFYLPNQFWKHKNHAVVVDALGLLQQRGHEIVVVATGNPLDPRHPNHLASLNERIEALGVRTNFRILGMVPRAHVISLMRTCAGLINPSFFEGWSSTVEEGRTLGVPMLLSAIDVHREQMGTNAVYFDPDDPGDLADKLLELALNAPTPVPPRGIEVGSAGNLRRFAGEFVEVVTRAGAARDSLRKDGR